MNPKLRRILFSLAVLVWSGVLLYFHASGRINKYLAPDFRPIAFAGGLGLAVLGLFNLLTAGQSADCGHDHGDDADAHDHETSDVHPLVALLLMVLPVVCSVAWTKDEYSAAALARKGLYDSPADMNTSFLASTMPPLTREQIEKNHRKTADGYYEFNLMEMFFATGDREMQAAIDGLKVETEGRWIDEKTRNPNGTRKRLYRLFITCCAADSRAIPIVLEFGKTPPDLPENGWVKVAGTMRFLLEEGVIQPVLVAERALAAEPPFEESFMRK
ncbi:MAG: TIGR03943 family protein [Luteolibacter sp.]|jgi:uncharacterized repeat protein (TIGR03943 family)|nr:TIGR03943 family protein [Luteolibacter sp.]